MGSRLGAGGERLTNSVNNSDAPMARARGDERVDAMLVIRYVSAHFCFKSTAKSLVEINDHTVLTFC